MRRAALLLPALLLACSTLPSHPGLPPAAQHALRGLEDHADRWRPAALVVSRGGTVLVDRRTGAGRRPLALGELTKLFTATAAGLLAGDGRLAMDERAERLLPGWGTGLKARVTLRQLLSYGSGVQEVEGDPYVAGNPDVLGTVEAFPVEKRPGTTASYGDAGYILAGAAVARAAKEPLDAYL
ncbi:MAG: beta-lactamase family protein, partial [Elusimicrobia bacterium]|nr:beta-lactamase family protein [Elusimicrobiota bacterium]